MSNVRLTLAALGNAIHLLASATAAEPATWPQWRGPTRDGNVGGAAGPEEPDTNRLQRMWSVEPGPSYSGPIVGADCVFTSETRDKKVEAVTAFDRKTRGQLFVRELNALTAWPWRPNTASLQ
jgi:hypothetical protein